MRSEPRDAGHHHPTIVAQARAHGPRAQAAGARAVPWRPAASPRTPVERGSRACASHCAGQHPEQRLRPPSTGAGCAWPELSRVLAPLVDLNVRCSVNPGSRTSTGAGHGVPVPAELGDANAAVQTLRRGPRRG
ncbi:hypothetical protein QJS66_03425 [Kocuria rhizophila]|nr:hypothetical protein QJS66_03425 [Kocuria rhizophila]